MSISPERLATEPYIPYIKDVQCCRKEEGNIVMWILILFLTILNLFFVYKNKSFISKITVILTTILYVILSWHDVFIVIMMIKTGLANVQELLWSIINTVLLVLMCVSVFRNCRKLSLCLLWSMILILLLGNWNNLLTYILYFKFYFEKLLNK